MGWIADLIQELPVSAALKAKLEKLESEYEQQRADLAKVREENERLKAELAKFQQQGLDEIEIKIITLLAQTGNRVPVQAIAGRLQLHPVRTEHYLNKLVEADYVYVALSMMGPSTYSLSDKGMEYVVKNNIV